MKTSIPSDVWEKKKALIARLYKDEEWPLKQVIKQIRTEDFNPSETQLRSRLKKWRVTKPSRQIRKKPAGEQGDNNDEEYEEDGTEEMSPVETRNSKCDVKNTTPNTSAMAIPTPPQSQHSQSENLALTREWYPTDVWVQSQQEQQQQQHISPQQAVIVTQPEVVATQAWTGSISAPSPITTTTPEQHPSHGSVSQINTPVITQFATHALPAYDFPQQPQQPSPTNSIPQPQTTHVLSPTYVSPTYAMAHISYPQPAPPTATHWPTGNDYIEPDSNPAAAISMQPTSWYTSLYDAAGAAATNTAYYHGRAVNPVSGYNNPIMQHMPSPQEMGTSYQVQAHAHAQTQAQPMTAAPGYHGYDEGVSVRPWRRATTSHYTPEYAPGVVRVDRQGRQRKPVPDRKRKESVEEMDLLAQQQHHQEHEQLQSMQQSMHPAYQPQPQHPQYIAAGHSQPLIPHDIYAYAGHEQLLQRPLGH
uniref:Clr5 domain-containing protein n=1 Tax=Talaromyces marneffei PM1 TaxID=1077442 RepID=A0A093UVQ4_TALMA